MMRVAPEGWPFILGGAAVFVALAALAAWLGGGWSVAAVLWAPVAAWVPWFFRDPEREGPRGEHLVLAPADGKIVGIADVSGPQGIDGPAVRISIFMNVFNVHVNRYPVSGTVRSRDYRPGAFLNATLDKASEHNEQMSLGIRSAHGPLTVRQIAGLVARRIVTDAQPGDAVRQGDRLGLIRFGSRVDTFLPAGAAIRVRVGERTTAGVTVLAEWSA